MKTYNIFIKQNKENNSIEDVLLIKDGFNIFACIFNIFWFLFNKLWLFAFITFIMLNFSVLIFSTTISNIFILLFLLLIGFESNNLLLYRFQREGYYFVGYSIANSKKEAELKFLDDFNKNAKDNNRIIY